jgi:hypothetical protein
MYPYARKDVLLTPRGMKFMNTEILSIEERLKRLEDLFSFNETSVYLTLESPNKEHRVELKATNIGSKVSVRGQNHIMGLYEAPDISTIAMLNTADASIPAISFSLQEDGTPSMSHYADVTLWGLTVQHAKQMEAEAFKEIEAAQGDAKTNAVFRPQG